MTPGDTLTTPDWSSSTDNHVKLPRISNIKAVSLWIKIDSVQDAFDWDYILDARPGLGSGWIAVVDGRWMSIGSRWNVQYYTYENDQAVPLTAMPVYNKWVFVYAQAQYAFTEEITLLTRYSENEDLAAKVASFTLWDAALTQQQIEQLAGGGKLTVQPINEFVADQADLSASTWPTPDGALAATIKRGPGSATGNLAAEVGLPACIECHTPGCGVTLEAELEAGPTAVVSGSLTLSGISAADAFASEAVLQDAVARVADVPTDAVMITGVRSVQRRRALRRRLEASTVVVDYEVEATNSEAVARKLADATPSVFDEAIQSAAAAAGVEATFADVKTEELSAESADSDEDDASAAKTASVTLIASVAAGICCLAAAAVMVKRALLARRGKKKTPAVVEPELPRGAAVVLAYAQPLASIKERAMVAVAHTAGEKEAIPSGYGGMGVAPESEYGGMGVIAPEPSQEGEYEPEC